MFFRGFFASSSSAIPSTSSPFSSISTTFSQLEFAAVSSFLYCLARLATACRRIVYVRTFSVPSVSSRSEMTASSSQGFGSGSVLDPDSIRSVDPDTDP